MPGRLSCEAIVLAGTVGDDKHLQPFAGTGTVKALLPIANKPLLSYPLKTLANAGLRHAFVVVAGERAAASISAWLEKDYQAAQTGMQCEVVVVPEDYGTADALRHVSAKLTKPTVVVISGDLLTDVSLSGMVATHQLSNALVTVLLANRRVSPASETKLGKPPKNVDYIGLDSSRQRLLFYASSPDTLRDLKVPLGIVKRSGAMSINSGLVDAHLYIFNKTTLALLSGKANLSSIRQDLLPWLTQQQTRLTSLLRGASAHGGSSGHIAEAEKEGTSTAGEEATTTESHELPGAHYMTYSHNTGSLSGDQDSLLHVHIVPKGTYCARVDDLASFAEVNREVADPSTLQLSGLKPGKHDNVVPSGTVLGNKATIAAGCLLGEGCVVGDKTSIKRSVLGSNIKLGANVKVINSVILDGAVLADNSHCQNSIVGQGVVLQERASIKDCQVGPGVVVVSGADYLNEVLAKPRTAA